MTTPSPSQAPVAADVRRQSPAPSPSVAADVRRQSPVPSPSPTASFRRLPLLLLTLLSTSTFAAEARFQSLFNGHDFSGLDLYLAPDPATKKPLGLNNDPYHVFTVTRTDGEPAIHVTGEVYGAITTQAAFTNVHIRVQYKWGPRKWAPRNEPRHYRDSGILYWAVGPHGAGSDAWMRSVEYNVMEKGVGQWWSVAGAYCDVEGRNIVLQDHPAVPYRGESPGEKCVLWSPGSTRYTVQPWEGITSPLDPEKPHGQWNTAEVIAWGNQALHLLNGQVVLALSNPRFKESGSNRETRLSHGRIQLQSEAAELFYRHFEARPIDSIPDALLTQVPSEPADDTGFTPLLTGPAASQWKQAGPGRFELRDGIATGRGGMGLWWYTNRTYANFILRGEWRQSGPKSDSGIFFRFPNPDNDPWVAVRRGHEVEIGEIPPAKPEEATGCFYPFHPPQGAPAPLRALGDWNSYELTCVGPNYALRINGRLVNTWTDDQGRPLDGYIGLQNYDYPDAVQHRNVRIKPIL